DRRREELFREGDEGGAERFDILLVGAHLEGGAVAVTAAISGAVAVAAIVIVATARGDQHRTGGQRQTDPPTGSRAEDLPPAQQPAPYSGCASWAAALSAGPARHIAQGSSSRSAVLNKQSTAAACMLSARWRPPVSLGRCQELLRT